MKYKYCPECGAKLFVNEKFCSNCGEAQPTVDGKPVTVEQPVKKTAPVNKSNKQSRPANVETKVVEHQEKTVATTKPAKAEQAPVIDKGTLEQKGQENDGDTDNQWQSPYNGSGHPTLINSFKHWFKTVWNPKQCMGRADYWWGYLGFVLINLACMFVEVFIGANISSNASDGVYAIFGLLTNIFLLYFLFFWFISILATIQRLHDAGYSGWNYLWCFTGIGALYVLALLCLETNWHDERWPRKYNAKAVPSEKTSSEETED